MSVVVTRNMKSADVIASRQFAEVFQAYLECANEIQCAIRDMVEIVNDPEATKDEIDAALITIAEALFPSHHNGALGVCLEHVEQNPATEEAAGLLKELDEQEASFAERVNSILSSRNMTQGDLAEKIGVGQPAVSMMLSRACRPQKRTVEKIAVALEVSPEEIWPGFSR